MLPTSPDPLAQAILRTLIYADLFDYALTLAEIHHFLIGQAATRAEVQSALEDPVRLDGRVARQAEYLTLPCRENLVALRQERRAIAAVQWNQARRYARLIAHLPFVRMVAVTGALAVENSRQDDDIDYLIVTAPGHLWTVRGLTIGIVRLARVWGDQLCPNFFVAENALFFPEHNLFTAHEIIQAVPLYGRDLYARYRESNRWVETFLPNAQPADLDSVDVESFDYVRDRPCRRGEEQRLSSPGLVLKRLGEKLLSSSPGKIIEDWEQTRKIKKLRAQIAPEGDLSFFTADCCKGHFGGHARRVLHEYHARQEQAQA